MEKTVVLFGAGAEVDLGMSGGKDFAKKVIGIETEQMDAAIKDHFSKVTDEKFRYPNSTDGKSGKIEIKRNELLDAAIKKCLLDDYDNYSSMAGFNRRAEELIGEMDEAEKDDIIDKNSSYMGILDERFYTLIHPRVLGIEKFWTVVHCYWHAYLTLVKEFLEGEDTKEYYLSIMQNPKDAYEEIKKKASGLKSLDSYYSVLGKTKNEVRVVTTNYTPLCSVIAEDRVDDKSIAYIHGSFKWFERPKELSVIDITDPSSSFEEIYFPFMFLQSGLKPVVHPVQLREYAKALEFLDDSSRMIIVGYQANHDDNHLNSLLREYLMRGKRIDYIDFGNVGKMTIEKRLHIYADNANLTVRGVGGKDYEEKKRDALRIFEEILNES